MIEEDFDEGVLDIAALADPIRRSLYRYVVAQTEPVSRDQASAGTGAPRHVVKFHLDKLVEQRLLDIEYRRLTGRSGPGAGRPAKLYRRADRQITVTIPERRYELAARLLAEAAEESMRNGVVMGDALASATSAQGDILAERWQAATAEADARPVLSQLRDLLANEGYEPRVEGQQVLLTNCPFHELAAQHTQLVCGLNYQLLASATSRLFQHTVQTALDPGPRRCCVTFTVD
jgi:predicted ArsR family transcriptional regulator